MKITLEQMKSMLIDAFNLEMEPSEITEDTIIVGDGLELDSVDTLEIIVELDKRFQIKIPNTEIKPEAFQSVGKLIEFANKY